MPKKSKYAVGDLVRVFWQDHSGTGTFKHPKDMVKFAREDHWLIESVGWIHSLGEDRLVLMATRTVNQASDNNSVADINKVVRSCITKVEVIKKGG